MQSSFARRCTKIVTLAIICFINGSHAQEWILEKQAGEITVSSSISESGYKNVLAKTTVTSDLSALLRLFDDVDVAPSWIANAIRVEILDAPSPDERLFHTFFNSPWPIKNRDMVTYSKTLRDLNSIQINIINKGNETPLNPNYQRMEDMFGVWIVTRVDEQKIEISYQGGGNPAGNIPRWMANNALIDATFDTFVKLSEIILLEKYQSK